MKNSKLKKSKHSSDESTSNSSDIAVESMSEEETIISEENTEYDSDNSADDISEEKNSTEESDAASFFSENEEEPIIKEEEQPISNEDLFSTDPTELKKKIAELNEIKDPKKKILYDLLLVYLVNLSLYKKEENNQILKTLHELSKAITSLENEKTEPEQKQKHTGTHRPLTKNMQKNLPENVRYQRNKSTPRQKFKKKAEQYEERKRRKNEKKDILNTKSAKFN